MRSKIAKMVGLTDDVGIRGIVHLPNKGFVAGYGTVGTTYASCTCLKSTARNSIRYICLFEEDRLRQLSGRCCMRRHGRNWSIDVNPSVVPENSPPTKELYVRIKISSILKRISFFLFF